MNDQTYGIGMWAGRFPSQMSKLMFSDMLSVPRPAVSGLDSARVFLGETTQETHTHTKGNERDAVSLPGPDTSCFSDLQILKAPPLPSPEIFYQPPEPAALIPHPS